ncbi:ADP-ribosylglycohydrolase family protein [Actinokineospora auranticolor]|uniref:ADP-ribosylglycohydrolase n=1 Tax=Actinokineospora auranticolor TaxID=155976 RepID=A0A2S6GNM5_9PSEU|nr:ADP-ribosylglycohydrolase family protein [Actinokineospora auranticolor]PPK66842.1 ADP-ribosylglycohydrolase [Actinokineospora auranticolor]
MLVHLAIGDAYGAGFEYAPAAFVTEHNTLERYVQHGKHAGITPGRYTDDTQMTLAVAELLVDGGPWTPEALADRFFEVFDRDPREGYASGFHGLLSDVDSGAELLRRLRPHSDKSGAAMRVSPVGLLPTVPDVLRYADIQARVTHDSPGGVASSQAAALAVFYCDRAPGPLADLPAWIASHVEGPWETPWRGTVGSAGMDSARAAITALAAHRTMSALLRACVAYTGDVDTVATIALAAASRSPEITDDLPAHLVDTLEDGPYGRAYLSTVDEKLTRGRPAPGPPGQPRQTSQEPDSLTSE